MTNEHHTFGRYVVQTEIGRGASGIVYRGIDPLMDRVVAIKTVHRMCLQDEDQTKVEKFLQRFQREARASGVLSHPNIVTVFDIGEENGLPYIAMEYIEGETLSEVMKRTSLLKEGKVIKVLKQVADALDYAHSQGVIHRDVKPGNVMYCAQDQIKVMDFSIARMSGPDLGTITTSGTILGTPFYMPPEQIQGDKITNASDVYSLGVMAYEILTGSLPFPGSSIASVIYKVLKEKPIVHKKLFDLARTSNAWDDCFMKVLAKDPSQRQSSAGAFVSDLEKHFNLSTTTASSPQKTEFSNPKYHETRLLGSSLRKQTFDNQDNSDKTRLLEVSQDKTKTSPEIPVAARTDRFTRGPDLKKNNEITQTEDRPPTIHPNASAPVMTKGGGTILETLVLGLLITLLMCIIYIILAQFFPALRFMDLPFVI